MADTLLRKAEHYALQAAPLSGHVLDVGGDARGHYRTLFSQVKEWTTVNMDTKAAPTLFHDLETPLPLENDHYDGALLMNVLEHIYHHRELLQETVRVVKPGGTIVVVVPFLFPVHPSPHDYWRFTGETLERLLVDCGCADVVVTPLGSGVLAARFLMIERLLPGPLRTVADLLSPLVVVGDSLLVTIASLLKKKYRRSDYALGYVATGTAS